MYPLATWNFVPSVAENRAGGSQPLKAGDASKHGLIPLMRVRAAHALLFTLLVAANYFFRLLPLYDTAESATWMFLWLLLIDAPSFVGAFAIIGLVQSTIAPGHRRWYVLVVTLLAWAAAAAAWTAWGPHQNLTIDSNVATPTGLFIDTLWDTTTYFLLAAWAYESGDWMVRATTALREAELARRSAERWVAETRLGVLQARLEPRVLFDTLEEARRLYRSRPHAAEQLLDALIHYLRCALPKLCEAESTMLREVDLAIAYARVLRGSDSKMIMVEADVAADVADARFPPMIVQPLCHLLARVAIAGAEPARIQIEAARRDSAAQLLLKANPVHDAPTPERLAAVGNALHNMFGPFVRLEASCFADGIGRIFVEVPYAASPRTNS